MNRVEIGGRGEGDGKRAEGVGRGRTGEAEGSRGRPGEQPYGMRNLRPTVRIANPSRVPLYYFK